MQHNVKVENTFSGPLDLMLHLVMRDELDIHDIPISHLTREFLAEMERLELVDVDAGGEFVAMASMLTEIKSRMLLPPTQQEGAEGEEEDDFDPRAGLVQALLEYKRFKEVAAELETLAQRHMGRFGRMAEAPAFSVEIRHAASELGALDLFAAFQRIARRLLNESAPKEIVSEEVPTEVRIQQIQSVIEQCERASFTALLSDNPTRDEMVGFFIAILELVRLKRIRAQQSADFTEIYFFKYDPQRDERSESAVQEIRRVWRLLLGDLRAFSFSGRYPAVRCPRWLHLLPLTGSTGTPARPPRQIPAAELMYHRGVERYQPPLPTDTIPAAPAALATAAAQCSEIRADTMPITPRAQMECATGTISAAAVSPAGRSDKCGETTIPTWHSALPATKRIHPVRLADAAISSAHISSPFPAPVRPSRATRRQAAPIAGSFALFAAKPPITPTVTRKRPSYGIH